MNNFQGLARKNVRYVLPLLALILLGYFFLPLNLSLRTNLDAESIEKITLYDFSRDNWVLKAEKHEIIDANTINEIANTLKSVHTIKIHPELMDSESYEMRIHYSTGRSQMIQISRHAVWIQGDRSGYLTVGSRKSWETLVSILESKVMSKGEE